VSDERPRFCPFCGEPIGSFFDRCQEWFRAERVEDHDAGSAPGADAEE
jgi:hypothetical protein